MLGLFCGLAGLAILSALAIFTVRKPVHAVLLLVLVFLNSAALMVSMAAEFLGMFLIVIYVGAIAILFLFTVMMLDFNISKAKQNPVYLGLAIVLFLILSGGMLFVFTNSMPALSGLNGFKVSYFTLTDLANGIYIEHAFEFQVAGFILLVGMITAILTAFEKRSTFQKHQNISQQIRRDVRTGLEIKKVKFNEGVDL
jgi:NADH-quinone oxidoreductase subunit J